MSDHLTDKPKSRIHCEKVIHPTYLFNITDGLIYNGRETYMWQCEHHAFKKWHVLQTGVEHIHVHEYFHSALDGNFKCNMI